MDVLPLELPLVLPLIRIEPLEANEVKMMDGKTQVFRVKSQQFDDVANFTWKIIGHAGSVSNEVHQFVVRFIQSEHKNPKIWHKIITYDDANNKNILYLKMIHPGTILREDVFKDGNLHNYLRYQMIEYEEKPNNLKEEMIVMQDVGHYKSDLIGGSIYVLNENLKLPVSPSVNEEILKKTDVIWIGKNDAKRAIKVGSKVGSIVDDLLRLTRTYHKQNFGAVLSLLGMATVSMNREHMNDSDQKVVPLSMMGPSATGNFRIQYLPKQD
jgi:hypothetical protein